MGVAISGLGASINPARLGDPIEFFAVTDGIYYRHATTQRVFKLLIDRERIAAANDSEADSFEEAAEELGDGPGFQEVPPDVIAHAFARPIAGWQLSTELGGDGLGIDDLVHDLADEIDVHVIVYPLAEPVPAEPIAEAVKLTAELVLITLDAVGPISLSGLETVLTGRGVDTGHTLAVLAELEQLTASDLAEVDKAPVGADPLWSVSPSGADRAGQIRAALVALAE